MTKPRQIPNPNSVLLREAVIGGAGLGMPPDLEAPPGMAMVLLFVPAAKLSARSLPQIQEDIGLPWAAEDGSGVWFDELG